MKSSVLIKQIQEFMDKVGDQEIYLFDSENERYVTIQCVGFTDGQYPSLAIYDPESDQNNEKS